ncbi:MAG: hypothetical protein MR619_03005 [Eubacterium sp.]|nr:hypothetical protein [Eubacterium sp.]
MNIDENVQKVFTALLKKWKLIIVFALIGAFAAFLFTAKFTTLTYTSTIEFLAYAVDYEEELNDNTSTTESGSSTSVQRTSQTSKMNYAMRMLDTYIEVFSTNNFNQMVADELNKTYGTDYSAGTVKGSISIQKVENTAMFYFTVTTTDADLSYHIAQTLETCVPQAMDQTNQGLVQVSVEDAPMKAGAAESMQYPKKCIIGAIAGILLAALYAVLREFLDVRIKGAEDLSGKYDIPVLGSVPEFEISNKKKKSGGNK